MKKKSFCLSNVGRTWARIGSAGRIEFTRSEPVFLNIIILNIQKSKILKKYKKIRKIIKIQKLRKH